MADIAKEKSQPTPAEKTGGPPSGVGGPQDSSAVSQDQQANNEGGSGGVNNIQDKQYNEDDAQSPTLSPGSPDMAQKLGSMNLNSAQTATQQRHDRYGTPIIKLDPAQKRQQSPSKKDQKEKKFKVSFLDKVDKDSELARVHYVQSYKKYNAMNTFDPWDVGEEESSSHCCTIF